MADYPELELPSDTDELVERLVSSFAGTRWRDRLARAHRNQPRRDTPKARRRIASAAPPPLADPMATLGHAPRPRRRRAR